MKDLKINTIGASPAYPNDSIEMNAQTIADALQSEISGGNATEMQAEALTQEFVDRFSIKARYTSGTLLGFNISDEALDEFETFKKR